MRYDGKIIVLAYPDTFVTMSDEWICRLLPLVGLGTREYIKAGHAALILIENETGKARYFDFGRYVTPNGFGRVRGANTDAELKIPFRAKIDREGQLNNLDDFLLWLDAHPEKTHGEGRLLASVCDAIEMSRAEEYIMALQGLGSIPYGAFDRTGSNCSRFVTDTILAATSEKKIIKALKFNKIFTPSTVGNVEKAALSDIYEVFNGGIRLFKGSAFKENLTNYFHRKPAGNGNESTLPAIQKTKLSSGLPQDADLLSGIGSNAWFKLLADSELPKFHFRIKRFNDLHEMDFDGVYYSEEIDLKNPFTFTYDSHCMYCHVIQNGEKIRLDCKGKYTQFNSSRKVRSA